MRVFLVEDNPKVEQSLRDALATIDGATVVAAAATAPEAARWLRENGDAWDLAVVDIFLRVGHGFEVLRTCVERGARRVVLLSNYTRDPVRSSARTLGADAVFDKSYQMEDFLDYCAGFAREQAVS